jgi:hypothetical protein
MIRVIIESPESDARDRLSGTHGDWQGLPRLTATVTRSGTAGPGRRRVTLGGPAAAAAAAALPGCQAGPAAAAEMAAEP